MLSHLDVSNQRQTAMKRIALCCGCAGLAFVAMVWFGLLQRMQAAENTLPDHQVHALPTKIQPQLIASYGKLPLSFEANQGQTDARVRFLARGSGYTIFLTDDEAVLILRKSQPGQRRFSKFGFPSRLDPIRQIDPRARRWPSLVDELNSFWPSLIPDLSQLVPEPNAGKGGVAAGPESQPSQVMRMRLEGGNAKGRVVGLDELPGRSNYFIGNDPKKWRTNVPSYAQVKYKDIYPGVDLLYYGNQRQLEYDFVVAPGADPNQIKLSFAGADGMRVDAASGDLVLKLGNDEVRFRKPAVYQPTVAAVSSPPSNFVAAVYDRRRRSESAATGELDGAFVVASNNQVAFRVAAYDPQRALVIDPVLSYSTFLGGSNVYQQGSNAIAVDSAGDAYVTGNTIATDFPTTAGAVQPTCGGNGTDCMDVFVTKLDPTGSALAYSTYLGGTYVAGGSWNIGLGIAVDTYGNAYVTGWTGDSDFPTTAGAFQPSIGSDDAAFVTKLNPTGSALVYSTYLGGYGFEQGSGIAVDGAGNAYVAGRTGSPDFPTTAGAFQTTYPAGSQLAFITKLNAAGSALVYSTFLGNSNSGGYGANAIAVDSSGNAYVTGTTYSTDFPTVNPIQGTCNNCSTSTDGSEMYTEGYHWGGPYYTDAFVAKLNAAGSALVYSTYLGGSDFDFGYGIAVDPSGNAYVTGFTYSTDFPTANPLQATNKAAPFNGWWEGGTGFVAELNSAGSALVYSTYLGGSDFDLAAGIAVDSSGNAYVTGVTYSNDFPSVHPFPVNNKGGPKVFVAELNTGGSALVYSTYLGAHGADWGQAIAVDSSGSAYVTGWTQSADFPTVNPFQATLNAGTDAFVTKISLLVSPSPTSLTFSPEIVGSTSAPQTVTVTNIPTANLSISTVTIGGANASDFATNADTCTGATLTPNGSCTVSVTFTPSAVGSRSASITITDNASNSPQTVGLTGTGTDPVAGVSPPSLTFGNQNLGTTSGSQPVTLSNTGNAALTITGIVTSANFGATNNCAGSVAASGTCTITVTFSPTASGPLTGTLTITDNSNGVAGSQQTVGLTGTGTGPAAGVSPPSLTFGNQNPGTTSGSQPVTLSNTGNAALTITSIVTTANFGQTNNCAGSVAASGSCTINVTFSPTAIGSPIGALIIADNATSTPQVISLTGTGVWPVVTSAGSVSFGGTLVGQTSGTQTVTLTNNGSSAATINGISSTGGFSETNNCGTSLAVGASCTITVASDPTSPGSTSGTLTINDSDPGSPHTVVLQGIGLAPDAIVTMAGGGPNNLPALNVGLSGPTSVAFDVNGNYYIVAHGQGRVFKVDTSGNLTVFAGNGSPCSPSTSPCGDGQAATSASLSVPYGVAADGAGNVYIADVGTSRIRRVDATTGTITTVAGNGINCTPNTGNPPCYSGDSQAATSASLSVPYGVAVDQAGNNLYIADSGNNRISQVVIATGTIYAFAGNGTRGYSGDNGPATGASLSCPMGVAVDWMSPGNVYIADTCNYVIREVDTTGTISTVAGGGGFCSASFWAPSMCGDGGLATSASLSHPTGVAVVAGDIYIADDDDSRVRVVSQIIGTNLGVPGAAIQTLVGTFQDSCFGFFPTPPLSQGMHSNCAGLNSPWGVAVDYFHGGRVFIADTNNNLVRWAPSIRGIPFPFLPGEDGTAAPGGLPWIMITAGNGTPAYAGDGGPATNASFSSSLGVAVDQAGNIYIPDPGDHCVRQVSAATGIISTVAGNAMAPGYGGDGG
ncbi:MAG: choice-of-anchor D domain-containing protein, partial [Terriglobia bacterium]